MKTDKGLLMVMVDALQLDYWQRGWFPKLKALAEAEDARAAPVDPPLGFEPDHCVFAGLNPLATGGGAMFRRPPPTLRGGATFSFVSPRLGRALDGLPRPVRRLARYAVAGIAGALSPHPRVRRHPTPAAIPFARLREFEFAQLTGPEDGVANAETVFDMCAAHNVSWYAHTFPRCDVRLHEVMKASIHHMNDAAFHFLHVGDLDSAGHAFGPESDEVRRACLEVDEGLVRLIGISRQAWSNAGFILFGDHGMVPVNHHVNVVEETETFEANGGLVFIDSTMLRVWHDDRSVAVRFCAELAEGILGGLVQNVANVEYDATFADEALFLQAGAIFHPSYFADGKAPRGMHGYGGGGAGDRTIAVTNLQSGCPRCAVDNLSYVHTLARSWLQEE